MVECQTETWHGLGFADQRADITRKQLEEIFAEFLEGGSLIPANPESPRLAWSTFKTVTNDRWHAENLVLVGDAAHTTHYSIGSGTKLALADAAALANALHRHGPTTEAFDAYQSQRRPETRAAQTIARHSARFFENIDRYANLRADLFLSALRGRRHRWMPYIPAALYARIAHTRDGLRHSGAPGQQGQISNRNEARRRSAHAHTPKQQS